MNVIAIENYIDDARPIISVAISHAKLEANYTQRFV